MNLVTELHLAGLPDASKPNSNDLHLELLRQFRIARRLDLSVVPPPDETPYRDSRMTSNWKNWLRAGVLLGSRLPHFGRFCEIQLIAEQLRRASDLVKDTLVRDLLRLVARSCENMTSAEDFPPKFQDRFLELAIKTSVGMFTSQLLAIQNEKLS